MKSMIKKTPGQAKISFWSWSQSDLLQHMQTNLNGLSSEEAKQRLSKYGLNSFNTARKSSSLILFFNQFKSPITLILLFAAFLSLFLGEITNTSIIFSIIFISASLSFWQEKGAKGAVEKLLSMVQLKASVLREGKLYEIPTDQLVKGDIITLSAGDIISGDCLILQSNDLFINEASLTGETFPIEKTVGVLPEQTPLSQRHNTLYMGTNVVSGSAQAVVVYTGNETTFGQIAHQLSTVSTETEFETGIKKFGYLLMKITLILIIAIFAINVYFHRPILESLLFSLALAVGLTPQLLPAIISINLSQGAKNMAKSKVIVKKLSSIENFGSMNVLCSDKTGTLTEGKVEVKDFINCQGESSKKIALYSLLNSKFEVGFKNPIDAAIVQYCKEDTSTYSKTDEIPYDFIRKRLSIVVNSSEGHLLITKGAFQNVLDICTTLECAANDQRLIAEEKQKLQEQFEALSKQGLRVIALAYKNMQDNYSISKDDEVEMIFLGFITLYDPAKEGILETINQLNELGISLKIITGDNKFIAAALGQSIYDKAPMIITGKQLSSMSDEALVQQVNTIEVFAEIEPNQKAKILWALKKKGNVVGYIGDGINDASALHIADVGISVDTAVDVAKQSADIVLLDKNLNVLIAGVKEGRKTFSNTLKYLLMATSANFGNMFSMAGASLFLPFLPLLPAQILFTNLLTDLPAMTISSDNSEASMVDKPRKLNLKFIKQFMIAFGLLSSVFDFITFGVLLLILKTEETGFRTGWFVESVVSASLVALIVRSKQSIFTSRPGKYLTIAVLSVVLFTFALPYTPLAHVLGFTPLPLKYLATILLIVLAYIASAEMLKKYFYKKFTA